MSVPTLTETLAPIVRQFEIPGATVHAEVCKIGHINQTYLVVCDGPGGPRRYVFQRINRQVFRDPPAVMENLERVCRHLRGKLEASGEKEVHRRCLHLVPARNGRSYCRDDQGEYWRAFVWIEGVRTYEAVEHPEHAREVGRAFGEFQQLLSDLPGPRLHETIPDFHDTRKRFEALVRAIERDPLNRAREARAEIAFALRRESITGVVLEALERGLIPTRVVHNDTKFNNVLMDRQTDRAVAVVDLDTVMPGCVLYDFGDMVRTATSPAREDERDLSKVRMEPDLFRPLVEGYLGTVGSLLTPTERELLAFAGRLITFETGLRFLTDFLLGDTYFRIHRPGHNLDRCRSQFRLVESLEQQEETMQRVIASVNGSVGSSRLPGRPT